MDRKLLIRAGSLYFIPLVAGVFAAFLFSGLAGHLMGYGWKKAIMFIALPIMGGGTSAGAVPTSQIYGAAFNSDPKTYLSLLMPAVAMGNAVAIVSGGLLNRIGNKWPSTTGNGVLLKNFTIEKPVENPPGFQALGIGFVMTGFFFAIGMIMSKVVPSIHYYAWTIISVGVAKGTGIIPADLSDAAYQWYRFMLKICVPAVLFGIGAIYTDLGVVIEAFSVEYLALVLLTVFGAVVGTWFAGKIVGFYPVESSITAGLCMANMGGTGDVATLGAAHRMELMPFAQISSRLGGAMMLIVASVVAPLFGKIL